jgi:hypothetical protein
LAAEDIWLATAGRTVEATDRLTAAIIETPNLVISTLGTNNSQNCRAVSAGSALALFEMALVLVPLNHIASQIVNANYNNV